MMQFMRKGFFSGLFIVFLGLGGFSLVLTDWTGTIRSGLSKSDVAKVGRETISQSEFSQLVQRTLRAERIAPDQAYQMGMINQILTSEVWNRMLAHAAFDYGIAVGDDTLLKHLQDMAAPIAAQEKTTPAAIIKRFIESQGISEGAFTTSLRREMTNNLLRQMIVGNAPITSDLVANDLMVQQAQTRSVSYFVLPDADVKGIVAPDDATLTAYYDSQKESFMLPERRSFRLAVLPRSSLQATVKVTDADIQAFYHDHKDDLTKPEQRVLQMAVYAAKDESDAQKLAQAVKSGKALLDEAKKIGKPLASTEQPFAKEGFLPELADPTFTAKLGDVVGPIKTSIGWHVIKVKSIEEAGIKTLTEAHDDIERQLTDDMLSDAIDAKLDLLDRAHENGEALDGVVKDNGMTVTPFTNLTRDGQDEKGVDALKDKANIKAALLTAAFGSDDVNRMSAPLELANGDIGLVEVTSIAPAHPRALAEIKDTLVKTWMAEQAKQKNIMDAQALLPDLVAGKTTLADVAKTRGTQVLTLDRLTRTAKDLPANLDRSALIRLFDADLNKPIFQPVSGGLLFAVVRDISLPSLPQPSDDARKAAKDDLAKGQADEMIVQYLGALSERYDTRINKALIDQMFAPKTADQ